MCYHSQREKTDDIFTTFNLQGVLPVPECPEQVEYLVVLDSEEEGENPESKAFKKPQVTDPNISDQKAWNKLNISDDRDKWKLPSLTHDCQDSNPKFTSLNTTQESDHFISYSVAQHEPDIYQNGPWVIYHKNLTRSSQTCSAEQNEVSATPAGLMEHSEQKQTADCKQKHTIQQEEDYSKVSGIYRETVLVIQKDSSPVQKHKKRNNDEPSKQIEISSSAKKPTGIQEYIATL